MDMKTITTKKQLEDMIDSLDEFIYLHRDTLFPKRKKLTLEKAQENFIKTKLCANEITAARFLGLYNNHEERRALIFLILEKGYNVTSLDTKNIREKTHLTGGTLEQSKQLDELLKKVI